MKPIMTARPFICLLWQSPHARIVEHHRHPFYEMLVLRRGVYEYSVGRQSHTAQAGEVVLYTPGMAHTEQNPPDDPPEFYHIKFHWPGAPRGLPVQLQDKDGRLRMMAEWLCQRWFQTTGHYAHYRSGCLAGILAEVLRLAERDEDELVTRVHRYILARMGQPLTLADLARSVHLSRNYFARRYRRLSGHTAMDDVRRIRLANAKNLLVSTNLPLKSVAAQVGFSSAISLSHAMRKYEHLAPSEIRGIRLRRRPSRHGS